jgi:menaquinol-cytochrome c reductase iron-sulfur subunit
MTEDTVSVAPHSTVSSPTRRTFHLAAIYALAALITLLLAIPTILYFLISPRLRKESRYFDAGDVSELTTGSPVEVSFQESRLDGWRLATEKKTAWVVKGNHNQIIAFGPRCTHLGCAYHWESAENSFICPCHGSLFSIEGEVLAGPAPRPLDRFRVKVQNNRLLIGQLKPSMHG